MPCYSCQVVKKKSLANPIYSQLNYRRVIFPLQVRVDQSRVDNFIVLTGDNRIEVTRAQLRARTRGDALHIHSASVTLPDLHVQLHGQNHTTSRLPVSTR